jgi:DNA-directed RNA polymerase I subunit RPA2
MQAEKVSACHLASFDDFIDAGLSKIVKNIEPVTVSYDSSSISVWIDAAYVKSQGEKVTDSVCPKDCREGRQTYAAPLAIDVCWSINGSESVHRCVFSVSNIPIMVGSKACKLYGASSAQLIQRGEEESECGGYFIVGGIERVVRLLIQQRRHYVMGLIRNSFCNRGAKFTKYATTIRCVDHCERSSVVRLHYLTDGSVDVGMNIGRQEVYLPIFFVIRALVDISDVELREYMCRGVSMAEYQESHHTQECLEKIFELASRSSLHTRRDALAHMGTLFRTVFPERTGSDCDIGEYMLTKHLFIHLKSGGSKLDLIIVMLNKLLCLAFGKCKDDNPDSLVNQEILLPGYLLQMLLHEKLSEALQRTKIDVGKSFSMKDSHSFDDSLEQTIVSSMKRVDIGRQLEYFLATGNLVSKSGLGLSQSSGFTIVAEKLNYLRYISHFRSIHRGAYFAELRTTTVRKLLPESWGFLCPVHTPDGSPCGLLTHMTASCIVTMCPKMCSLTNHLQHIIRDTISLSCQITPPNVKTYCSAVPVLLDGSVLGYVPVQEARRAVEMLRARKVSSPVVEKLEIAAFLQTTNASAFPCIALFSSSSRLMRPVHNIHSAAIEVIGTMEQDCVAIDSLNQSDSCKEIASHREICSNQILSIVASLTPWSDFNQSPRNMYQCQMAKQTMGVPLHTFPYRSDTKLYRLHTPQRPIASNSSYDKYRLDDYPLGTNAVVAVLSHTGYDMEDAMIVNKSAVERGFAHATLLKTDVLSLRSNEIFSRSCRTDSQDNVLDDDGLPYIGQKLHKDCIVYSAYDKVAKTFRDVRFKGTDEAVVEKVKRTSKLHKGIKVDDVSISVRYNRNPVIGDKFSSRHGQKGVLSFLWPDEDLPYIEKSGIRPDVLINPHAFPSRMTIGMLVESSASKCGALIGQCIDSTPFKSTGERPFEVYGEILRQSGYSHSGTETMMNGLTGEKFAVDIYIGVVYYQRLRHMVNDKFQVRSTGPNNALTKQPIKGRKAGGGVRFGEMERDSLLAHGAAYLLRDRLHLSSDTHILSVCAACGSLISTTSRASSSETLKVGPLTVRCQVCRNSSCVEALAIPYVFKYLATELAAMNIRIQLKLSRG